MLINPQTKQINKVEVYSLLFLLLQLIKHYNKIKI